MAPTNTVSARTIFGGLIFCFSYLYLGDVFHEIVRTSWPDTKQERAYSTKMVKKEYLQY